MLQLLPVRKEPPKNNKKQTWIILQKKRSYIALTFYYDLSNLYDSKNELVFLCLPMDLVKLHDQFNWNFEQIWKLYIPRSKIDYAVTLAYCPHCFKKTFLQRLRSLILVVIRYFVTIESEEVKIVQLKMYMHISLYYSRKAGKA